MKILLVEDDQLTSELLSETLSAHRYLVDAVADGALGLEMATQWSYDLILLDILIPTLNGFEVCRQLRAQGCKTPYFDAIREKSDEDIIAGLDIGADDYLAKSSISQLLARVRALLRRNAGAASIPLLTWERLCLDPALIRVTYDREVVTLRPKEYALLELFLRNPHRVLTRSDIIDRLWSMEEIPVESVITNLIKSLRYQLKAAGMVIDLIETVYGLGYRLKQDPVMDKTTRKFISEESIRSNTSTELPSILVMNQNHGWEDRERFRVLLEQRLVVLETAKRSLQTGNFDMQQLEITRIEAHKLTGGLEILGYAEASKIAQAIGHLLETGREPQWVNQLPKLLKALRQTLAQLATRELSLNSIATPRDVQRLREKG